MITFNRTFPTTSADPDLISLYERAMIAAGFNFSDSEQFMEEYFIPELERLHQEF